MIFIEFSDEKSYESKVFDRKTSCTVSKHLNNPTTELKVTDGIFKLTPTHASVIFLRLDEFAEFIEFSFI